MKQSLSFVIVLISVFFLSCKSTGSMTNVINGIEDTDNRYPAVLTIFMKDIDARNYSEDIHSDDWSGCSSSVISHNTLLTASHCLTSVVYRDNGKRKKGEISVRLPSGKTLKAKEFYINETFFDLDESGKDEDVSKANSYDVGIVVFEDHTFDGITPLKISNRKVQVGDKLQLVGYSCQTKVGPGTDEDDPARDDLRPLDVCKNINNQENGHVRRYGTASVVANTEECSEGNIELRSSLKNANYDPKDRVDPPGVNSASWFGDSGGPVLLYENQNLIVGMPSGIIADDNTTGSCVTIFNPEIVEWLKHLNDTTDAIIPMDEIK